MSSSAYRLDPSDPRAPSDDEWAAMTPDERARAVEMLPAYVPIEMMPPEGDAHRKAKTKTEEVLDSFFRRIGRRLYVSSELAVYYPGKRRFSPDILAVTDVESHERTKWAVQPEGKGLDFVLEVVFLGKEGKDDTQNVSFYAELGIPEYFIFDRKRLTLKGYALPTPEARVYKPILPQAGRFMSRVLGLELALEDTKLRFYFGAAVLPEADELVARLEGMMSTLMTKREEAEQQLMAQLEAAEQRLFATREAAEVVQRKLDEALAEIERLKKGQ